MATTSSDDGTLGGCWSPFYSRFGFVSQPEASPFNSVTSEYWWGQIATLFNQDMYFPYWIRSLEAANNHLLWYEKSQHLYEIKWKFTGAKASTGDSFVAFLLVYYLSDFYKNIIALRKKIKPWEITLSLTSSFHWLQTSLREGYSLGLSVNFFF